MGRQNQLEACNFAVVFDGDGDKSYTSFLLKEMSHERRGGRGRRHRGEEEHTRHQTLLETFVTHRRLR